MSIPDFNSDISPYNLGVSPNNSDDDAEILDNLVEQDATPPEPVDIPRFDMPPVPKVDIPAIDRLITRTVLVQRKTPMQLCPADPWRRSVRLDFAANPAGHVYFIGPTATECQSMSHGAGLAYSASDDFEADYNGELWIYHEGAGEVSVSVVLISSGHK